MEYVLLKLTGSSALNTKACTPTTKYIYVLVEKNIDFVLLICTLIRILSFRKFSCALKCGEL